jgi:hypothetical protein
MPPIDLPLPAPLPAFGTTRPYLVDLVHDNPGEPPFASAFKDPQHLRATGYHARCFQLFDSVILGLNWQGYDPQLFPVGSAGRDWVDRKAADLGARYQLVKDAGLEVLCMSDLILVPRSVVDRLGDDRWKDPRDPASQALIRYMLSEAFDRFPQLDGLVVRIGETYLNDAPHHVGGIRNKRSVSETVIPLLALLRDELCCQRGKRLIFRTWLSFDTDSAAYDEVSAAVEPHPLLAISVKHCEGDFHRGNRFSRVLGRGCHPQIVEVQCQREYEGKGAHPNYIAEGVIHGFEEYSHTMAESDLRSLQQFAASGHFAGVWTWSRGGGWLGPYPQDEFWCTLNAWVLVNWAHDPQQTEAAVFDRYCTDVLHLDARQSALLREICLLSARAVVRGKRSTHADIRPWWSRDHFIGWPKLPTEPAARARVLAQKFEAEDLWQQIGERAADPCWDGWHHAAQLRVSCAYGYHLYRLFRITFEMADCYDNFDRERAASLLQHYAATWESWRQLAATHPQCATLYSSDAFRYTPGAGASGDPNSGSGALAAKLQRRLNHAATT